MADPMPAVPTPVPEPFTISIPISDVERLQRRLADSEQPSTDIVPGASWDYGVPLEYLKELKRVWTEEFNWREVEKEMNAWSHFKVPLEGLTVHFLHQRSSHPDAIPLLLLHGWPGSFFEFSEVIGPLTNPPEGEQAFHVVVPSLPGFVFSSAPPKQGWTVRDTARTFDRLMTEVLGYKTYAAQGGDWGSYTSLQLAAHFASTCRAIHLNMGVCRPPFSVPLAGLVYMMPTWISSRIASWYFMPEEMQALQRTKDFATSASAHFIINAMQPALIGYALYDSPIGILTWVGEKYGNPLLNDPSRPIPAKKILATVSLYYFTRSIATSGLPYRENVSLMSEPTRIKDAMLGISVFKCDIFGIPKGWIEKFHKGRLKFHRRHDHGGHFAALDSSTQLVGDLREYLGGQKSLFAA